jgi:hypothetical protein
MVTRNSSWLSTAAALVRSRVWSSIVCGGQSGAGAGFSPSTSVSPANLYSTKFSSLTITRGRYDMPITGRRVEWTQFGLHPSLYELKKINPEFHNLELPLTVTKLVFM